MTSCFISNSNERLPMSLRLGATASPRQAALLVGNNDHLNTPVVLINPVISKVWTSAAKTKTRCLQTRWASSLMGWVTTMYQIPSLSATKINSNALRLLLARMDNLQTANSVAHNGTIRTSETIKIFNNLSHLLCFSLTTSRGYFLRSHRD